MWAALVAQVEVTFSRSISQVVIGHVDAGKSTLMGRVLHAVGAVGARPASHRSPYDRVRAVHAVP